MNRLWHNAGGGKFTPEALAGPEGDTLTLLFTDLNGDGWPDLVVGNDFDEPDRTYLNEHGKLRPLKGAESPIPMSTTTTMSADAADIDNDGHDELYLAQIAMGTVSQMAKALAAPVSSCEIYPDLAERTRCDQAARFQLASIDARNLNTIEPCMALSDPLQRRDCVVTAHHWFRVLARLPALGADKAAIMEECAKIPADFTSMKDVCGTIALSPMDHETSDVTYADEIPSLKHTNLLYTPGGKTFRDITTQWHAGFGGWSWNARFADLDNDGWQDSTWRRARGSGRGASRPRSTGTTGERASRTRPGDSASRIHVPTGSYVYVDVDNDGDLDVITHPFQLTSVLWRNDAPRGKGLALSLEDRTSPNRRAVGARVEIARPTAGSRSGTSRAAAATSPSIRRRASSGSATGPRCSRSGSPGRTGQLGPLRADSDLRTLHAGARRRPVGLTATARRTRASGWGRAAPRALPRGARRSGPRRARELLRLASRPADLQEVDAGRLAEAEVRPQARGAEASATPHRARGSRAGFRRRWGARAGSSPRRRSGSALPHQPQLHPVIAVPGILVQRGPEPVARVDAAHHLEDVLVPVWSMSPNATPCPFCRCPKPPEVVTSWNRFPSVVAEHPVGDQRASASARRCRGRSRASRRCPDRRNSRPIVSSSLSRPTSLDTSVNVPSRLLW